MPTTVPAPAGRRRADVPVDFAASPTKAAPYAGRRVALLDREPAPGPVEPVVRPGRTPAIDFGDDTMERVLGALEPVDHTTSFENEPTEQISLAALRAGDADQVLLLDPASLPRTATAGKRRATRRATRRPPIVRMLPSVPALLGIAALAASIGGTLAVHDSVAPTRTTTAFQPASILTGLTGANDVGRAGSRADLLTRDAARQSSPGSTIANRMAQQRVPALAKQDERTDSYEKVLASNQWITPVTPGVYHLTARFGQYGLWASFHTGLDFAAPTGTPIHAIASGTVTSASYDGSYGNKTVVQLADGTEIWYAHQNEFGVSVGDTVTQGEVIGYVGSTGNTTGPHVHIEVRPGGGDPVDPYPEFVEHGITP